MGKGTIKNIIILGNCRKGLRIRTLQSVKGKLQDGKEINYQWVSKYRDHSEISILTKNKINFIKINRN